MFRRLFFIVWGLRKQKCSRHIAGSCCSIKEKKAAKEERKIKKRIEKETHKLLSWS